MAEDAPTFIWAREGRVLQDAIGGRLSISQLARDAHVQRSQIHKWMRGEAKPSRASLARIAGPLGVDARELIGIYEPVGGVMDNDIAEALRDLAERVKSLTETLEPLAEEARARGQETAEAEAQARASKATGPVLEGSPESSERSTPRGKGE